MEREKTTEMTKERILQAVIQEFGTNGYAASRLNAICSTHGIPKGLIYYHFSGKDDLYLACVSHCFLDVTEYLKEKDIGMPGSCCLRRSGHCGRRLTPLIEGYIGARAGIVRSASWCRS